MPTKTTRPSSSTRAGAAGRRPRWFPIVVITIVGLIIGLLVVVLLEQRRATPPGQDAGALPATRTTSHVLDSVGPDAPTLVEFLDYECEACGALHPVVQELRENYRGKINYVVRYFPLSGHANAIPAALAAEAAAQQGRIDELGNLMLERQAAWGEKRESQAHIFRGYAEELGLDMAKFDAAVADPATLQRVQQDFNDGVAMGVKSTPTFIVDGKLLTLNRLSDLTDPIDQAIAAGPRR